MYSWKNCCEGSTNNQIEGQQDTSRSIKRSWNLESLRKEGMKIENATHGGAEISSENEDIFKLGPYSYRNMQDRQKLND